MKIFIEFWKAKDAWHQMTKVDRIALWAKLGQLWKI